MSGPPPAAVRPRLLAFEGVERIAAVKGEAPPRTGLGRLAFWLDFVRADCLMDSHAVLLAHDCDVAVVGANPLLAALAAEAAARRGLSVLVCPTAAPDPWNYGVLALREFRRFVDRKAGTPREVAGADGEGAAADWLAGVFRALARRSAEAAGRVAVAPPGLRYVLSDAQAADSAILLVDRAEGAPPPVPRLQAAALEAFRRHFAGRLPALAVDPDRMMPTFDRDGTEDNSGKYGHWQQLGRLRVRRRHVLRVFARRVVLTSHFDGFAVSSPSEVGAATAIGYRSARVGAVGSAGVIGKTWERDVEEAVADVFNAVDGARL